MKPRRTSATVLFALGIGFLGMAVAFSAGYLLGSLWCLIAGLHRYGD